MITYIIENQISEKEEFNKFLNENPEKIAQTFEIKETLKREIQIISQSSPEKIIENLYQNENIILHSEDFYGFKISKISLENKTIDKIETLLEILNALKDSISHKDSLDEGDVRDILYTISDNNFNWKEEDIETLSLCFSLYQKKGNLYK